MIRPEELRIGNFVACTFGIRKVKGIIQDKEKSVTVTFEDSLPDDSQLCSGIPLTPEWFLKFGFIKNGRDWDGPEIETERYISCFTIREGYHSGTFEFFGSEWTHGKPFEFVHQLQNIFFDLAHEELTIKESA